MVMAGEIQEPFAFNFQADSLHSGSISFGRFEGESLSWERRSSFSHNRYLEEVEKYSKPGSVTEKKAYFEAHFRRKALQRQSSSECQNGIDYQSNENDASNNMGSSGEFEHDNEGSHYIQFDRSSAGSEYGGESEVMEKDRDDMGTSHIETVFESTVNNFSVGAQSGFEYVDPEEAQQIKTESFSVIDAEPERAVKEEFHDEAVNVDLTCRAITTATYDTASLEHQRESSLEVPSKLGSKSVKTKSKSLANVGRVQRNVSGELSKVAAKKPFRAERESLRTTKTEKQLPQIAAPTARTVHRNSKQEGSESSKLKVIHATKSERELKHGKIVEPQPSVSDKAVPKARQTTNRAKHADNSTKPGMKQSSAGFNFESDQRPARGKEVKTEADIKQLRKSLSFRATPMPSFYREPVKRDSDRDEAVSSNTKSNKLRTKSGHGSRAAGRSPAYGKAGNHHAPSNTECANTSDPPQLSVAANCSLTSVSSETSATSQTHRQQPTSEVTGRKKHSGKNEESLPKHRGPDRSNKVLKGHRLEGKHKVEAGTSNTGMVRKDTKGIGIGGASGTSGLAVGVVS